MVTNSKTRKSYDAHRESAAAERREFSAKGREIGSPPPLTPESEQRRGECERDFRLYCETYHAAAFPLEWSDDHLKVIALIESVVLNGGLFAIAMPRGSGKTTLCRVAAEWAILYGHRGFVVLIGQTERAAQKLLEAIKKSLLFNPRIASDFPREVYPIVALEGQSKRCMGQTCEGNLTSITWKNEVLVMPTLDGSRCSGSIISVCGLTGNVRGQQHTLDSGEVIRPDLVIPDDPQTRESAHSVTQTTARMEILMGDVLGMAGPGEDIAGLMPCTVIAKGDLADQALDHEQNPEWQGTRTKMLYSWPTDMEKWEEYGRIRSTYDPDIPGDQVRAHKLAIEFYRANREAMDAGAEVSWPARKKTTDESALQHCMDLWLRKPDTFMAEYQNEPVMDSETADALNPEDVQAKVNGYDEFVVPVFTERVTAHIDVQKHGLWYAVAGWGEGLAGGVMTYGSFPDIGRPYYTYSDMSAMEALSRAAKKAGVAGGEEAILAWGLEQTIELVMGRKYARPDGSLEPVGMCLIDAGYKPSVVREAIRRSKYRDRLMPAIGKGIGAKHKPMSDWPKKRGGRRGLGWDCPAGKGTELRHVLVDVNTAKAIVDERLRTPIGDPGCLSLYGRAGKTHRMFAEHITSEFGRLMRDEATGRAVIEYEMRPNRDNHGYDNLVGSCVAALMLGVKPMAGEAGDRIGQSGRKRVDISRWAKRGVA